MLAGLSKCGSRRTPPCFCADAGPAAATISPIAAIDPQSLRCISSLSLSRDGRGRRARGETWIVRFTSSWGS